MRGTAAGPSPLAPRPWADIAAGFCSGGLRPPTGDEGFSAAIAAEIAERPLKRHARVPIAHVAVKVEVGQSCDHQNLGGKIGEKPRHARDQFRELKTGEGAGDLNL